MKIKRLILVALTALALGLASVGVGAQAIAAGNAGAGGGDVHTLAGRKPGAAAGSGAYTTAGADVVAGSKGDQFSGRESNLASSDSVRNGAEPS